jgi:hypothetical protein
MATFTMQHERNDSLGLLLRDMNLAYRAIKSGRKWATFTKRWELAGNVSSLEITYGNAAGFHPHKHVLFFSERTLNGWDAVTIETELSQRWRLKLGELGQYAHQDIAVKVQIGFGAVARYLTKWGEEPKEKAQPAGAAEWTVVHEMTKANVKAGRTNNTEHYSPFQLLELYKTGAGWAGAVFVEYAKATKGLQQLRWSTGLRELLGLGDELSDEEIAAAQDETAQVIATLPWQVWNQVCKKGLRGLLLEVSHTGKANVIYMFLAAHGIMTDQYKESHPG